MDYLLQKLNDLPAPDFSNGIDLNELAMSPLTRLNDQLTPSHEHSVMFKQDFYPSFPSPPDTPSAVTHNIQQFSQLDWDPSRSMNWNGDASMLGLTQQNQLNLLNGHQRAMSLPHIQYPNMNLQMRRPSNAMSARRPSTSSTGSEKTFFCSHQGCDRSFSRVQNLRSHMRCHLVTAPHSCKHCGLGFRRTTDLQRHIRTMHTPNDQKPWACPKCPKRFGRSDALKRHMTSRSKDHGCPGGPDLNLLRQMEEQKRQKAVNKRMMLETVQEQILC
jgi:uncharacterized Zn-finger protein